MKSNNVFYQTVTIMKKYPSIDIAKFILSIIVVVIHVNPFGEKFGWLRFPVMRVAVPLFFLISSFLLFSKLQTVEKEIDKQRAIRHFIQRNLQLYAAWFVILLPITCKIRGYLQKGFFELLRTIIVQFLFSSTFSVSWYIMALIIGTILVYYLCKYISDKVVVFLGLAAYVLCCLATNYRGLINNAGIAGVIVGMYPADIYLSFPASIIWICFGKIIAENKEWVHRKAFGMKCLLGILLFGILFLEHYMIQKFKLGAENDCYVSLILLCPWLFSVILKMPCTETLNTRLLRESSTIIYCSHRAFQWIYEAVFRRLNVQTSSVSGAAPLFLLVLLSCFCLYLFINKGKTIRGFSWLRYLQ